MLCRCPITDTDFLLLPRFWDDSEIISISTNACARESIPGPWGAVELFTTHLSLSERNECPVKSMWNFVKSSSTDAGLQHDGKDGNAPTLQVVLGDFNAEPDSAAIQCSGLRSLGRSRTDLRDAWLGVGHPEPEPPQDPEVRRNALTFPSYDPKKRIDLILYHEDPGVTVNDVAVVGQDAEPSTADDPGHGMLDMDSPMWASDHRGVVAEFRLEG